LLRGDCAATDQKKDENRAQDFHVVTTATEEFRILKMNCCFQDRVENLFSILSFVGDLSYNVGHLKPHTQGDNLMPRRNLTELARNPDLISGIYNYCDRWCERCPLSSRCLLYATEQEDEDDSPESRDIQNEAFWRKLSSILQETREMVLEWANEAGIELEELGEDDEIRLRRKHRLADNHPLARAGKKYANAASDWFREFDQMLQVSDLAKTESDIEEAERLVDAREIIYWYQYQIAVKTMRALSSRTDEQQGEPDGFPRDSDGSAKVALLGIDRSIAAWRLMQLSVPDRADTIVPLILQLETLRYRLEKKFPDARDFVRPGFDEVLGEIN
jgi:hypothetical protein